MTTETLTKTDEAPFLDVADPAFSVRSAAVAEARARSWYARTPYGLAVLRYDQVNRLMKDKRLIQGSVTWPGLNGIEGTWAGWWMRSILNREGDDHARLRRLLNPAFAQKHVVGLVPSFQQLAGELVDGFGPSGRCEFMRDFAEPYATRVIARLLGIPEDEWRTLADWSADLGLALSVSAREHMPRVEAALEHFYGYADALIADRRARPGSDFVTSLVQARDEDDRLSDEELRDNTVLLIFGGIDTTRNQLGLALDLFLDHPDQWRLLGERHDLADNAVNEVMRLRPTVTWVTRLATEDFTFDGVLVPAGTTLHLFSEAAGTDPAVVGDRPGLDITAADRPRHFGFGGGRHHCLGHWIARGDMGEALHLLARRLPVIGRDGPAEYLPDSGNTGPVTLPLRFPPTAPAAAPGGAA